MLPGGPDYRMGLQRSPVRRHAENNIVHFRDLLLGHAEKIKSIVHVSDLDSITRISFSHVNHS